MEFARSYPLHCAHSVIGGVGWLLFSDVQKVFGHQIASQLAKLGSLREIDGRLFVFWRRNHPKISSYAAHQLLLHACTENKEALKINRASLPFAMLLGLTTAPNNYLGHHSVRVPSLGYWRRAIALHRHCDLLGSSVPAVQLDRNPHSDAKQPVFILLPKTAHHLSICSGAPPTFEVICDAAHFSVYAERANIWIDLFGTNSDLDLRADSSNIVLRNNNVFSRDKILNVRLRAEMSVLTAVLDRPTFLSAIEGLRSTVDVQVLPNRSTVVNFIKANTASVTLTCALSTPIFAIDTKNSSLTHEPTQDNSSSDVDVSCIDRHTRITFGGPDATSTLNGISIARAQHLVCDRRPSAAPSRRLAIVD